MADCLTDTQIEIIKSTYAETGRLRAAARAANCSPSTVKKYIGPDDSEQFEQVRTEKRIDIIRTIGDAKLKIIAAMTDETHLANASVHELAVAFGILTDKELLMTGQPNSRVHNTTDASATLTPEEMEQAAIIRERFASAELVTR